MCVNESWGGICREGKIPDLSQADTSYYQVHKIQQITKRHILLLDFAITTHKPTEICQVSCKNQSRINARVSDDTSSLACISDDTSNLARVSNDTSGPIRLWHVSPIKLRHVSLIHPQTPINRNLPKAFQEGWGWRAGEDQDWEVQKLYWNQALKPPRISRNSTSNTKNIRREIIQIIFLDLKGHWNQAQKPPEASQTTN